MISSDENDPGKSPKPKKTSAKKTVSFSRIKTSEKHRSSDSSKPSCYYVVEFRKPGKQPITRSMDVVYNTWVIPGTGKDAKVHFPAELDAKSMQDLHRRLELMRNHNPEWPLWKVKIRGRSDDLDEAFRKLKKCETQESALTVSEAETVQQKEENELEKIRQEKLAREGEQLRRQFGSSEEEEQNPSPMSGMSSPVRKRGPRALLLSTPTSKKRKSSVASEIDSGFEVDAPMPLCANSPAGSPLLLYGPSNEHATLAALLKGQEDIRKRLSKIESWLEEVPCRPGVAGSRLSAHELTAAYGTSFPLATMEDFEQFDQRLGSSGEAKFRTDVVAVLQACSDVRKIMSRSIVTMLKQFLTKDLALQFVGMSTRVAGKKAFGETRMFRLMLDVLLDGIKDKDEIIKETAMARSDLCSVLSNVRGWDRKKQIKG